MNRASISPLEISRGDHAGVVQERVEVQGEIAGPRIPDDRGEGGQEAQEEEHDQGEYGERQPRVGRRPDAPTKKEVEEHYPLHVHYRSWCPHCQAGRSTSKQHRGKPSDEEPLGPTISIDYAFKYDDEAEESVSPVLVVVDQSIQAQGLIGYVTGSTLQATVA